MATFKYADMARQCAGLEIAVFSARCDAMRSFSDHCLMDEMTFSSAERYNLACRAADEAEQRVRLGWELAKVPDVSTVQERLDRKHAEFLKVFDARVRAGFLCREQYADAWATWGADVSGGVK